MKSLPGSRVLVTGATGFLGSHLTRQLVSCGADVHAVSRDGGRGETGPSIQWWTCDVRDGDRVEQLLGDIRPALVFHLAGSTEARGGDDDSVERWSASYAVNLLGTLNVLLAVRRAGADVRRVVRTGGLEEYGNGPVPFREDQREQPVSPYSASQLAATDAARLLHRTAGLPVVTLRPALVYGPGQSQTFFIPSLMASCLRHVPFEMSAGDQTRDLVFVADVVDACLRAATADGIDGRVVNVGSGREYRIRDVAELVVHLAASRTELRVGARPPRRSDLDRLVCDPSLAAELLGWRATTSLESGLQQTLDWFVGQRVA
jgi:UDP-glucose 4-epimerase